MYKLLLILLLVGCFTLSVGHQTFADETVKLGNNHDDSSYNTHISADTYSPAAQQLIDPSVGTPADNPDSVQSKNNLDNGYQYRHRNYHRNVHYGRTGSQETMLFMLFSMMIIIFIMA
ncbi:MAG TPA: hypothetical protein DDW65_23975 [Firmicutes bacterium]|jgi:hypothetical protein|nr:hypothetical protein [Bacillota bacterium]